MSCVLGLDLASRITGACCGDGAEAPTAQAWQFPKITTDDGADYGLLLSTLKDFLDVTFARHPEIVAVGYEAPILISGPHGDRHYGDTLAKLRLLYPLGAMVEWYCRDIAKVPCHEITVAEAKSEVTGNAHAEKEDMALIAEKCGVVLPRTGRTDASDAWAVWKRMLRYYNPRRSAEWDTKIYTPRGALL